MDTENLRKRRKKATTLLLPTMYDFPKNLLLYFFVAFFTFIIFFFLVYFSFIVTL